VPFPEKRESVKSRKEHLGERNKKGERKMRERRLPDLLRGPGGTRKSIGRGGEPEHLRILRGKKRAEK